MHYLMMISDDSPDMDLQTSLLMRSINKFSNGRPRSFSLVVQGNKNKRVKKPLILEPTTHSNKYINDNADVYFCPYYWKLGAPCRWVIEPKHDMCVFIDVDMLACNDLGPLYDLEKDTIHGVTAHNNPLEEDEWATIGITPDEYKYYFNMGMLVVPSQYIETIGDRLFDVYPMMSRKFIDYYSGQISFIYIVKQLMQEEGIKRNVLPPEFNWFDKIDIEQMDAEKVLFLHYMSNRSSVNNRRCSLPSFKRGYISFLGKQLHALRTRYL